MKKQVLCFVFMVIASLSFAIAEQSNIENNRTAESNVIASNSTNYITSTSANNASESNPSASSGNVSSANVARASVTNRGIGQELREQIQERKRELKEGEYEGPMGQMMNVKMLSENLREIKMRNVSVRTTLNISTEDDETGKVRLKARLRNGSEVEVKVLPGNASEMVMKRLRIRNCSVENNCTISLNSVGNGGIERLRYEVQIQKHSKILWMFSKKMVVVAEVDVATGETKLHKPLWAFIASEPAE